MTEPPSVADPPPPPDPTTALFLDFDGTLAGLQEDPAAVFLPPAAIAALEHVATLFAGAVALLSGRDVRDLVQRTPAGLWRIGGHGLEVCAPHETPPAATASPPARLADALAEIAVTTPGVRLEPKGPIVAVHYRAAPEAAAALAAALERVIAGVDGYTLQAGKMVFELKPGAAHKGAALDALMERAPFAGRRPVMIGDDVTDEDGFAAAQARGGFGVKVGAGATLATHRLGSIDDVWRWLRQAGTA